MLGVHAETAVPAASYSCAARPTGSTFLCALFPRKNCGHHRSSGVWAYLVRLVFKRSSQAAVFRGCGGLSTGCSSQGRLVGWTPLLAPAALPRKATSPHTRPTGSKSLRAPKYYIYRWPCSGASALRLSRGACLQPPAPPGAPTRRAVFFIVDISGPLPRFFCCLACGLAAFFLALRDPLSAWRSVVVSVRSVGCRGFLCLLGVPPRRFFCRFLSISDLFLSTFRGFLSAYSCFFPCFSRFFFVPL